ncbi:MAG: glutamate--cysteine ligase [Bdellovibrio sp.]|nr:glutamate--cysteine ligase [Bdellovibrio sp.]
MSKKSWHLFEGVGLELEYMIVNIETLDVLPIVEKILRDHNNGELIDELDVGPIRWSNELVCHVLELKGPAPFTDLAHASQIFSDSIVHLMAYLGKQGATLLPTGMHPWMNPLKETVLWPHGQKEIYNQFNKVFGCQGHGWSNLQSMHINLPFGNEEEFGRLHAAIRIILPLVPALCASSPIYDGLLHNNPSNRLIFYESNQARIPSITGGVIPGPVFNFHDYEVLLEKMYKDIAAFDPDGILQGPWLNSRGAILKPDYGCIEIRLADVQEHPRVDVAMASFIVALLRELVAESFCSYGEQKLVSTELLRNIYEKANRFAIEQIPMTYAKLWGVHDGSGINDSYAEFLFGLFERVKKKLPVFAVSTLEQWFEQGPLAVRMKIAYQRDKNLKAMYQELNKCLQENRLFTVN